MSIPRALRVPRRRQLQHPARGPDLGELRPVRPGLARQGRARAASRPPTVPGRPHLGPGLHHRPLPRSSSADVRQRFTVAIMALGGGLAARGADLNDIILRSNPTLRRGAQAHERPRRAEGAAVRRRCADTDTLVAELAKRKGTRHGLHRAGRPRLRPDRRPPRRARRDHPPPPAAAGRHRPRDRQPRPPVRRTASRCWASCAPPRPASTARSTRTSGRSPRAAAPVARRLGDTATIGRRTLKSADAARPPAAHASPRVRRPGRAQPRRHCWSTCATAAASSTSPLRLLQRRGHRRATTRPRTSSPRTPSTAAPAPCSRRRRWRAATPSSATTRPRPLARPPHQARPRRRTARPAPTTPAAPATDARPAPRPRRPRWRSRPSSSRCRTSPSRCPQGERRAPSRTSPTSSWAPDARAPATRPRAAPRSPTPSWSGRRSSSRCSSASSSPTTPTRACRSSRRSRSTRTSPTPQSSSSGSEVRIGGFRVGQVNEIIAEPARRRQAALRARWR